MSVDIGALELLPVEAVELRMCGWLITCGITCGDATCNVTCDITKKV
ncbi:hypothetical protein GCM10009555_070410 [Acrocarpospora macrocephala]|uniref:Uncharacterized protein n=1 Tax=Acrocarpospora macrocephala TaxID=150177 RepID=A0A5M3WUC5_9ACTN|nr:hypothetical protein [Acrocarpospora macrocephala]GES13047.1 hypothetical protein Amac_066440 [Acrocarpospora macrocephala]